jgi:hypothetical protein
MRHLRSTVVALAVACLAIGAAVAANVALLGLVDRPNDRVGQLQLRLARPPLAQSATTPAPPPPLVVTPAPSPRVEAEAGPDD